MKYTVPGMMSTNGGKTAIPDDLKEKFKKAVAARSGLYFRDHDMRNLEKAVSARMRSRRMASASKYYIYLTTSGESADEYRELLNLLTIGHTYFFRNEPHFRALREKILPDIMEKKMILWQRALASGIEGKPAIRIWSAGCSTGEEPYSIAMAVQDVVGELDKWDISIYATDVSTDALEKARAAVYGEISVRLVDDLRRQKYFSEKEISSRGKAYEIQNAIKGMVRFDYLNLSDDSFPPDLDIIFCRNVTMYFDPSTFLDVMGKLHSSLADHGYLFMGYSESLQSMRDKFVIADWHDGIFYQKAAPIPPAPRPPVPRVERTGTAFRAKAREKTERRPPGPDRGAEPLSFQITRQVELKQYDEALSLVEKTLQKGEKSVELRCLAAEICLNQRKFEAAKEHLSNILNSNPLFPPVYYLYGAVHRSEGDLAQAKENLRKALFLERDFVMAHVEMAHVYKAEGKTGDAMREHRNALKALKGHSAGEMVAYGGGFSAGSLRSVCRNNIERLRIEK